jgi:two-component system, NarL family, nitrate/nitrite response regulator NarL
MRRATIATVLVGPSALLREGLTRILSDADFRVVASARRVDDLVLSVASKCPTILVVIDAADDLSATVREVQLFKERHPAGRIAVLADRDQPADIVSAFRAGANGYFIKVAPCDALVKYLELVTLGETILPAALLSWVLGRVGDDDEDDEHVAAVGEIRKAAEECLAAENHDTPRFSDRERGILNCLIAGEPNKVIARKIEISEATVKVHVKAILRKIRVQNRTQAAIWAMNNGLSVAAIGNGSHPPAKLAAHPRVALPAPSPVSLNRRNEGGH